MSTSVRRSASRPADSSSTLERLPRPVPPELFKWLPLTFTRESDRLGCEAPAPTSSDELRDQDGALLTISDFRAILEEYTSDRLENFSFSNFKAMFARIVMALVRLLRRLSDALLMLAFLSTGSCPSGTGTWTRSSPPPFRLLNSTRLRDSPRTSSATTRLLLAGCAYLRCRAPSPILRWILTSPSRPTAFVSGFSSVRAVSSRFPVAAD